MNLNEIMDYGHKMLDDSGRYVEFTAESENATSYTIRTAVYGVTTWEETGLSRAVLLAEADEYGADGWTPTLYGDSAEEQE